MAFAKVGDTIIASRETEHEHPWYDGTRVIECRVLKGRTESTLTVWGDGKHAHLVHSKGLPKCLVKLTVASGGPCAAPARRA